MLYFQSEEPVPDEPGPVRPVGDTNLYANGSGADSGQTLGLWHCHVQTVSIHAR